MRKFIQTRKLTAAIWAMVATLIVSLGNQAMADGYTIVTQGTDGTITFTPGTLTVAIIAGAILAVASSAALFVLALGVRWLYRVIKGAK